MSRVASEGSKIEVAYVTEMTGDPHRSRKRVLPWCRRKSASDTGAVLILALVYIVSISIIVGAIADWAMNDLNNTTKFDSASALDYAATNAVEVAVQSIRYTPLVSTTESPNYGACWTPATGTESQLPTTDGDTTTTITVWCQTVENLDSSNTRVVTFWACKSATSELACVASGDYVLTAQVTFDDYPSGDSAPLTSTCTSTCGEGATTNYWTWAAGQ